MEYCCEKWKEQVEREIYDGKADYINGWTILGCCGHCCVMTDLIFCPFCGNKLLMEELAGSNNYADSKPSPSKMSQEKDK